MSPMRTMRNPWKGSGRRGRRMLMFSATGICGAIRKPSTATVAPNPAVPIKACLRNRRRSKSWVLLLNSYIIGLDFHVVRTLLSAKSLRRMRPLADTMVVAQEKQQQQQGQRQRARAPAPHEQMHTNKYNESNACPSLAQGSGRGSDPL